MDNIRSFVNLEGGGGVRSLTGEQEQSGILPDVCYQEPSIQHYLRYTHALMRL
jgi:hypothetical protein